MDTKNHKKQHKKKKGKKSPPQKSTSPSPSPSSSSSSSSSPPSFLLSKKEKNNLLKMEGSWALDLSLSDSYDPVLKYMGMGWIKRSAAGRAVSVHHVKFDFENHDVEEEEKGKPVLSLMRDVELVGYNVGGSSMKFILDGEDRDLGSDEQTFAESSFASAFVRSEGKEIVGRTTFIGKDGKKAVEEEVRTLKTEDGEEMMVLTIHFTGEPDTDLTITRILRKRE